MKIKGVYYGGTRSDKPNYDTAVQAAENLGTELTGGPNEFMKDFGAYDAESLINTENTLVEISNWYKINRDMGRKSAWRPCVHSPDKRELFSLLATGDPLDLPWEVPSSPSLVRTMRLHSGYDRVLERGLRPAESEVFGDGYNMSVLERAIPGITSKVLSREQRNKVRICGYSFGPDDAFSEAIEADAQPDSVVFEVRLVPEDILDATTPGYKMNLDMITAATDAGYRVMLTLYPFISMLKSSTLTLGYRRLLGDVKEASDGFKTVDCFKVYAMGVIEADFMQRVIHSRYPDSKWAIDNMFNGVYNGNKGSRLECRLSPTLFNEAEEMIGSFYDGPIFYYHTGSRIANRKCKEGTCRQ